MPIAHQHLKQRLNIQLLDTPGRKFHVAKKNDRFIDQLWEQTRDESPTYQPDGEPHAWDLPPDFSALGSGYDIFGDYAYSGSSMAKIFDWRYAAAGQWQRHDVPSSVTPKALNVTDSQTFQGETALELQRSLSNSVDVGGSFAGLFAGSMSAGFNYAELRETKRYYTMIQMRILSNRYIFDWLNPASREFLSAEFRYALDNYSPDDIFKTYGTHFPTDIITGARLDYSSSTDILRFQADSSVAVTAEASANLMIGTQARTDQASTSAVESFRKTSQSKLVTYGGDYAKAAAIMLDGDPSVKGQRYRDWLATVSGHEVFVGFGSEGCLRGVWELCDDANRRQEIKEAAHSYMRRRDLDCRINPDRIVDVEVISGNSSNVAVPDGYEKVPYDLNKGAGGAYIYLCFRRVSSDSIENLNQRPVTDLAFVGRGSAPAGYEKIPVDLNKGAGGDYIYLCKKYGRSGAANEGIRDIAVIGGDHSGLTPPYGYTRLPQDLNKGAGGRYIYLCHV